MKKKKIQILLTAMGTAAMLAACGQAAAAGITTQTREKTAASATSQTQTGLTASAQDTGIDADKEFTDRDMEQNPDLSGATELTLKDGEDIRIDSEGVYVISGSAQDATILVDAADEDKVQLVLQNISITNGSAPCIYVKNADKVYVTTPDGESSLSVTGSFTDYDDAGTDAAVFSADDLVLNGTGTLTVNSTDHGICSKDDLKITGGSLEISCTGSALKAHDRIAVADGNIRITECNDGLHAENNEDDSQGSIYIADGTITVNASDDAIHGTTVVRIDGGDLTLTGQECIEGTYIQINDGTIDISASDDGINAASKSSSYTPLYEQNGGVVTIRMGAGDTDGVDSNGDIIINGGTIDITGQSTFDHDGTATYNGGTIIENGQQTDTISNQEFGHPMGGGNRPPMGDGDWPQMDDGNRPPMGDGNLPQMGDGNLPQMDDGNLPQMDDGNNGPGMGRPPQWDDSTEQQLPRDNEHGEGQ
ncbi:MAG: carbohydrate-binding domain-containing protein [Lachnospiraceae bacterium]|nr:carbohydrate-binding domain-containing protein [Lachnospiraceae bacterium]